MAKSWKTTVGGIFAAIGTGLALATSPVLKIVGTILGGLGTVIVGAAAKDSNVTGGTKPSTPEAAERVLEDKTLTQKKNESNTTQ